MISTCKASWHINTGRTAKCTKKDVPVSQRHSFVTRWWCQECAGPRWVSVPACRHICVDLSILLSYQVSKTSSASLVWEIYFLFLEKTLVKSLTEKDDMLKCERNWERLLKFSPKHRGGMVYFCLGSSPVAGRESSCSQLIESGEQQGYSYYIMLCFPCISSVNSSEWSRICDKNNKYKIRMILSNRNSFYI